MDRLKLTTIAHTDHVFCNPLSSGKVDQVLGLLDLAPGSRVLDVGCGKGEMLIRLIERFHASGLGIDRNPAFLGQARGKAASRLPLDAKLDLLEKDVSVVLTQDAFRRTSSFGSRIFDPDSFHAALCVGSTHALGGYEGALRALARLVRPGGHLVVGEGFWRKKPDPAYLEILDASPDELTDHAGNVERAVKLGLVPLYASVSSDDEWDHYEGLYSRAVERHTAAHSDDPDVATMRAYIRRWRDAYLRWGRSTLGFGLYLFHKPEE